MDTEAWLLTVHGELESHLDQGGGVMAKDGRYGHGGQRYECFFLGREASGFFQGSLFVEVFFL